MSSALSKKATSNATSLISLPRYCLNQSFHLLAYQTKECRVSEPFLLFMVKQERKDKVGERISALQQIVSPYGKVTSSVRLIKISTHAFSLIFFDSSMPQTDTASVLQDALHYIEFLHEQVKVCPFLFISVQYHYHLPTMILSSSYLRKRHVLLVQVLSAPYLQTMTAATQVNTFIPGSLSQSYHLATAMLHTLI